MIEHLEGIDLDGDGIPFTRRSAEYASMHSWFRTFWVLRESMPVVLVMLSCKRVESTHMKLSFRGLNT